jgi:hypothetical protein
MGAEPAVVEELVAAVREQAARQGVTVAAVREETEVAGSLEVAAVEAAVVVMEEEETAASDS